eukprot:COSAG01_NODE_2226_length_8132_cov_3.669862_6_plen_120_part_00
MASCPWPIPESARRAREATVGTSIARYFESYWGFPGAVRVLSRLRPCLLAVLRRRHARTHNITHGAYLIICLCGAGAGHGQLEGQRQVVASRHGHTAHAMVAAQFSIQQLSCQYIVARR